jgi:DNA-binding PadR family transcriptional regulator
MAKRRKVSNLLALVILATLAERPMHPYELASLLKERGKDQSIKINWGSLYTVVQNLERHGFVRATETVKAGRRPERTVYKITETGRAELEDWLREIVGEPTPEYTRFEAALSVVGVLPPDEVRRLLAHRLAVLDAQIQDQQDNLSEVGKEVPRIFLIEVEFHVALIKAEAQWVRSLLEEMDTGTLPGIDMWREYHQTGRMPPEIEEMARRGVPED